MKIEQKVKQKSIITLKDQIIVNQHKIKKMKKIIIMTAIAAAILGLNTNADAQAARTITGNANLKCTNDQVNPATLLEGSWKVVTNASGNLFITDKNNKVVRMVADAGVTSLYTRDQEAGKSVNCPFGLVVDNCGNLHIIDNNCPGSTVGVELISNETNGWSDPEMTDPGSMKNVTLTAMVPKK